METNPKAKFIEDCLECCANWGLIPTEFRQCMTWEEQVLWLTKFIKEQVLPTVNANTAAFNTLKDFVDHYFDNLDVQEEINNKLDEMAESGQLSDLIAQYIGLGALVTFDTLTEMIASTNLSNGTKCKTLGKNTKGDGFGAYYTIAESGDIELANSLYATLVPNFGGNNYYDEITYTKKRTDHTDYYLTTIPKNDSEGNEINLYVGQAANSSESPNEYSRHNLTTFTSNAALHYNDSMDVGNVIINGEIVRSVSGSSMTQNSYKYIGIKSNREIVDYQANTTTAQQMLSDGCLQAFLVYFRLIDNGEMVDLSQIDVSGEDIVYGKHPRQVLGQKADGTVIFLTCDGRDRRNEGFTAEQCADILLANDCVKAWVLDGGGSSSTSIKGVKINRNIDSNGTEDRYVEFTLNAKKETIDEELGKAFAQIGNVKNETVAQLMQPINEALNRYNAQDISNKDLNDLTDEVYVGFGHTLTNAPNNDFTGYFVNIPHFNPQYIGHYAKQIYVNRDKNEMFIRTLANDVFSAWHNIGGDDLFVLCEGTQLASTNTYQEIKMDSDKFVTNNASMFSLVNPDSNNISSRLKINHSGTVKLKCIVQFTATTAGNKYIQFYTGNASADDTRIKFYAEASKPLIVSTEFVYTQNTPSIEHNFRIYGTQGDYIDNVKLYVETI